MKKNILFVLAAFFFFVDIAGAEALVGKDIIAKSEAVYPGKDQLSKLTFLIQNPDNADEERKFVLRRYWKRYENAKANEPASKVLVFNEYPPDSKGSSFMVWSYASGSKVQNEQWLYIPILGKVEKVPNPVDEMFGEASLRPSEMGPRLPDLDTHTLLKEEMINKQDYYVVESKPKKALADYSYSKVVKWITKDTFLKEKAEYYDMDGKLMKRERISWSPVGDAWVWQKVVINNLLTNIQIIISINDVKVDTGLKDSLFNVKTMKNGVNL